MQQDTALKEGEACLPIGAAFDPFHFVDEPLNHTVAPGQASAATPCIPERQFPRTAGPRCGTPGSIVKSGRKGRGRRWKRSGTADVEAEALPVGGHDRRSAN